MNIKERIEELIKKSYPFVVYVKPNETEMYLRFQKDSHLYEFANQEGFVFIPYDKTEGIVIPKDKSKVEVFSFYDSASYEPIDEKFYFDGNYFKDIVHKAVEDLQSQKLNKVVLSHVISLKLKIDKIQSFFQLVNQYNHAFRYLFFHPKIGMWMGATPEQLVKIKNLSYKTVALAGTQTKRDDLIWEEKEQHEQQLVVDYIVERVTKFSSEIKVGATCTYKAGNLVHLKTDIEGKLNNEVTKLDFVNYLHPTSAICGMPLNNAKNFIKLNEKHDRKFYSGYLGEWNINNQTNLFVNLRCCEIVEDGVDVYVGCGVTKESVPENELEETLNKSKTILNILVKEE